MAEKANADDDVSFQGETLLSLKELVLEPCAAAEVMTLNLPTMII